MNENWWITESQLDSDQRRVIAAKLTEDHLVVGPPGSGKTNLLLLRAAYLERAGIPNFMVLVFTRTLREYLVSGSSRYGITGSRISTSIQYMSSVVAEHGVEVPRSERLEDKREGLVKSINELIEKGLVRKTFKVILLDEAQDYLPDEIKIFRHVAERLFGVADLRQKIYQGPNPLDTLEAMVDHKHVLRFHYRNGTSICKLADGVSPSADPSNNLLAACNYDEKSNPSIVECFRGETIEDQCGAIVQRLITQLKAYPGEYLGVLCPTNEDLGKVKTAFLNSSLSEFIQYNFSEEGFSPDESPKKIILSTYHGAKGLEFRTLHLVHVDKLDVYFKTKRNVCFTAVTRAKTILSIYYSKEIPAFFNQAIIDLSPPPDLPAIGSLFQGSKK